MLLDIFYAHKYKLFYLSMSATKLCITYLYYGIDGAIHPMSTVPGAHFVVF